jgi:iron complex outermembrane receptor protein
VFIPTLSSSLLELIDLDRVEILRGPQGTLAGKNSIGGAIKLFTAKPRGDGSGMLRVGYGSYDEITVRGMADFAISPDLAVRVSGMTRSKDGYVAMLDYGSTHPNSNVPQNNTRGPGNFDYESMGGQDVTAGRIALRWTPSDQIEINLSGDYTREDSEAIPVVLLAAGAICSAPACTTFNPSSVGDSNSLSSFPPPTYANPWLRGKNGQPVNVSCAFVPAGRYSCDTGGNLLGYDPRYVSYSNFMDQMAPTSQAPYKPYFALPITEFEGWGVHGSLNWDLSDNLELVYIGSYRTYVSKFGQDQDATPIPLAQLDNELNHWAWTSELRLNFEEMDGKVEGTVGAFYPRPEGHLLRPRRPELRPPGDDRLLPRSGYHAQHHQGAVRDRDWTPDGRVQRDLGACAIPRTRRTTRTSGAIRTGTIPNPATCALFTQPNCLLAGIFGITGSFRGDRWDFRAVTDYRFSDEFLAYASIATGFKGGGVNPRPFVADQRLPFNPETLTTYEAGFKADLLDRRFRLNGAVFLNKYQDIILAKAVCVESVLPTPCLRPANIGSADVKGLELEASVYPIDGLTLEGSLSLLDFDYTSPSVGGFLISSYNAQGQPVPGAVPANGIAPYTPELNYSVSGQYDYESDAGTFSIRLDGSYQGKLYTNAENREPWAKIPGRFLANGRISWTTNDEAWRVALEVQNIFDKYYMTSVSDITTSLGLVTGVPGLPRTWQVSVERRF